MIIRIPFFEEIQTVLLHMAPGMPPDLWWVTALVIFILALAATIDAYQAVIPDFLIFLGLLAVTATLGISSSWETAAAHLRQAIAAGALIWFINFLWESRFGYDALGMGDAKWTMLAVVCFGITPAIYAWCIGAILAVVFILLCRAIGYAVTAVTFSPFLFTGLILGLYRLRFIGGF